MSRIKEERGSCLWGGHPALRHHFPLSRKRVHYVFSGFLCELLGRNWHVHWYEKHKSYWIQIVLGVVVSLYSPCLLLDMTLCFQMNSLMSLCHRPCANRGHTEPACVGPQTGLLSLTQAGPFAFLPPPLRSCSVLQYFCALMGVWRTRRVWEEGYWMLVWGQEGNSSISESKRLQPCCVVSRWSTGRSPSANFSVPDRKGSLCKM